MHLAGPKALEVLMGRLADRPPGVAMDHRQVGPGDVFVALRGRRVDARGFALEAVARGAVAVVAEGPPPPGWPPQAIWCQVGHARRALSRLSAHLAGEPSRQLAVTAVTGTNGKTTTTYAIASIWRAAGRVVGRIGTVEVRYPGHAEAAVLTTPEAPDLHRHLAAMRQAGVTEVAMEASSHALAQWRLADVRLAAAVLTNVTRDHLDYHGTLARYRAAKARLFRQVGQGVAVVNLHDPMAEPYARLARGPVWTYGLGPPAQVRAERLRLEDGGARFHLATPAGSVAVAVPLLGVHGVLNALAAAAATLARGADVEAVAQGLAEVPPVPGRGEAYRGAGVTVLLDYAHNPDGLRAILEAARRLTAGRLSVVFGAEGDKDRGKRPLMGAVAATLADRLWITSDNPRSEPPGTICRHVAAGAIRAGGAPEVCPDRRQAILQAVREAAAGDVVVVAGRGPEEVQIVGDERRPLSDRQVIREGLALRQGVAPIPLAAGAGGEEPSLAECAPGGPAGPRVRAGGEVRCSGPRSSGNTTSVGTWGRS